MMGETNIMELESGLATFTHDGSTMMMSLCVNVGAGNEAEILPTTHMATVDVKYKEGIPDGSKLTDTSEMEIGKIEQNGTSVRLTYLTAHPSYNHRIIIVNRSNRAVDYFFSDESVITEPGIEATLGDGASGTINAKSQLVLRVDNVLSFGAGNINRRRAAATLNIDGAEGDIEVATTQVAEDGSTDTIVYATSGVLTDS